MLVTGAFFSLIGQQLAFPGAEGFGRFTTGGRGGRVIEVTNLNDRGTGSLRSAVETYGSRTVVFRISGTIELQSALEVEHGNITIAGQTAPGDGICIKGYPVEINTSNVIVRYLRFRLGDENQLVADALGGQNHQDIIIDHCSMSWSVDETTSFYDNNNFTMQWCIISESLYSSYHYKGNHGYGGIWGGMGASFHHNLLAHHSSRYPRFQGTRNNSTPETELTDYRNNVLFNWGMNSVYGGEGGNYNMVANYYKSGPATSGGTVRYRIAEIYSEQGKWYIADNFMAGFPDISEDNWNGGVHGFASDKTKKEIPHPWSPVLTHSAQQAYHLVLADAGAVLPLRDPVDHRIVEEVRTGNTTYGGVWGAGKGIIDSQTEVGGWPELNTYDAPIDDDHDGMADDWETAQGLDPLDPEDHQGDIDGDGYTNLENYINSLCVRSDFILPVVGLNATGLSATEIRLTWQENTLAETGFSIERSENDTTAFAEIAVSDPNDTTFTDNTAEPGTAYYYRIRALKDQMASIYSNIGYAKTGYADGRPGEVSDPDPSDGETGVSNTKVLHWSAGTAAASHDLYFGMSNPPEFQANLIENRYDPQGLQDGATYYWRIDEVNDAGTTEGEVWHFTTESFTEALAAHWKFNRGLGSLDLDASGHSNYAYLKNMTIDNWVEGFADKAISFTGQGDYIQVDNDPWVDFDIRGFTISFWIRQTDVDLSVPWISKGFDPDQGDEAGYQIVCDQDTVRFRISDGDVISGVTVSASHFITGEWVFVTAVRNRKQDQLLLYADADLKGSSQDKTYSLSQKGHLYLGTDGKQQDFFIGMMDDMRIYNYAFDAEAVSDLYQGYLMHVSDASDPNNFLIKLENYPNPFNPDTHISYSVPEHGQVSLKVINLQGQTVTLLVDEYQDAGDYSCRFDASDLTSGLYFCQLKTEQRKLIQKMMIVK
ncbi:T9SS type A sorting domain-containing protein [bacterium]|nr:T9SS type A sorting domain-containing protein [bacterium]